MTTLTRHSKIFLDAAAKVASGEADRVAIAAEIGIHPGTFGVWMGRCGIKVTKGENGVKRPAGAALGWGALDPDKAKALDEAVARVTSGEISLADARKLYPDLSGSTLTVRVRRANVRLGVPVKKRRSQAEMAAIRAEKDPK